MKALKIIVIIILVIVFQKAKSQDYLNTVGFRAGETSGLCYKGFVNNAKAMEGILSFRNNGLQLTALIETYSPVNFKINSNLFFYYGYGAHVGYSKKYDNNFLFGFFEPQKSMFRKRPVIGVDAIFGMEYRLNKLPLVAALDTKPYTEFFGFPFFKVSLFDIGVSLKYTF
ncbi:MAG: hypothetical protein K9J13_03925 [Saprospiraceae bacterium]|nr:hypothetical protein [Saprospiraceae bacterium]